MPAYNLGSKTFTGRLAFTGVLIYTSETNTLSIRKADGTEFDHPLTMAQDTSVVSNQAALITAAATPASVMATLLEEAARLVLSVSGAEVMRFMPPIHVTRPRHHHSIPSEGTPSVPPVVVPGIPPIFPLPRVRLADIRAGGIHANAQDGAIVYAEDAPNYSDGLYLRKAGSWVTQSGALFGP